MRSPNEEGLFKGYGRITEKSWIYTDFPFKTHEPHPKSGQENPT
jgi:hypothetical protein